MIKQGNEDPHSPQNIWRSIDKMVIFGSMSWDKISEFLNITKTPTFSEKESWSEKMVKVFYKNMKNSGS